MSVEVFILRRRKPEKAFTIVELLIAIVVIAILAAISIVAYNGVQDRAKDSELKADLNKLGKQIQLAAVDIGRYPSTTPEYKQFLVDAGYWEITRPNAQLKRFIYCYNGTDAGIVRMSAYNQGVKWLTGAERPAWTSKSGIQTFYATSGSTSGADVCSDIGITGATYNNWSQNLT